MLTISSIIKRFTTVAFGLAMIAGLSACNTVEGVGRDVQSAGDTIEDAAD